MKKPAEDNRKVEILNATLKLINSKGLNKLSTADIAKEVGIARGTLYHHYPSKEAIIDDLVLRTTEELFIKARQVAEDRSLDILQRIVGLVAALNINNSEGKELLEHINHPDNFILHYKVQVEMINTLPGIFNLIIEDGVRQGIFTTEFPYESSELFVSYIIYVIDGEDIQMDDQSRYQRIKALLANFELILGTEKNLLIRILNNYEQS